MRSLVKVLVDTSVRSAANVLTWAVDPRTVEWRGKTVTARVAMMVRRAPRDREHERQVATLPTIARLAREGMIQFVTYSELTFEDMYGRRPSTATIGDLFGDVRFDQVEPPIDRSFFEPVMFPKNGETEQLRRFCKTLLTRDFKWDRISQSQLARLPDMTIQGLKNIERFRTICRNAQPKHYPDLFHLWTGEANSCRYFLTMESKLTNFYESHLRSSVACRPVRPLELSTALGVTQFDPVPVEREGRLSFMRTVDTDRRST